VVLRELPWFTYRTPLWATWHRIKLRPLVGDFGEILLELRAGMEPAVNYVAVCL
jgi:hypothetical protein